MTEKPKLNSKALRNREKVKSKKPVFVRYESWRYKRLKKPWRRQKGLDNKARLKLKGWEVSPNVGFRGPRSARHLHPSGYKEIMVHNLAELEGIDPKEYAVRIAHQVGTRKKMLILGKTDELGLRVLNPVSEIIPPTTAVEPTGEKKETKKEQAPKEEQAPKGKEEQKTKKETPKPKEGVKEKKKTSEKTEKKRAKKEKEKDED
jgi:large subunit ribosomal protein L32e